MILRLASVGNPDFNQNPSRPLEGCEPDREVRVETLHEASVKCRQFIDENGLGGGNWAGGQIFDGGKQIARVSYNGRVWAHPSGEETGDLFDVV